MENKKIKLAAVGDIALSHKYDEILLKHGPSFPFDKIRMFLSKFDLVIGNLECPLSKNGSAFRQKCCLRADPGYGFGIKEAGFNILSIANNHILDFKDEAFSDTLSILDDHSIGYCGAGNDLIEAMEPYIATIEDIKIAIFSYCDVQIDSPFYAQENIRGIAPFNLEMIKSAIKKYREKIDILVVSIHWGIENFNYPTPVQVEQAHELIDCGVDLILGHHPHVCQGIEKYKNGYIYYSLGNFLFSEIEWDWHDYYNNTIKSIVPLKGKNKEFLIADISISKNGIIEGDYKSGLINDEYQAVLDKRIYRQKQINALSTDIGKKDYRKIWNRKKIRHNLIVGLRSTLKRFKNLNRIRFKHFIELYEFVKSKVLFAKKADK